MSEIKLLSCPFCGGTALCVFDPDGIEDAEGRKWSYQVICESCCTATGLYMSERLAVEAWNRRVGE